MKSKDLKPARDLDARPERDDDAGLARDTSYKLAVAGFHTQQLPSTVYANAPSQAEYSNTVYFDTVQPNAKQAARQLAVAMGPHTNVAPLPPEIAPLAQQAGNPLTVVVVGTAFGGEVVNPGGARRRDARCTRRRRS